VYKGFQYGCPLKFDICAFVQSFFFYSVVTLKISYTK